MMEVFIIKCTKSSFPYLACEETSSYLYPVFICLFACVDRLSRVTFKRLAQFFFLNFRSIQHNNVVKLPAKVFFQLTNLKELWVCIVMRYSLALFYGFADEKGYLALHCVRVKYLPNLNRNNYNIIYSLYYFGVKVLRSDI